MALLNLVNKLNLQNFFDTPGLSSSNTNEIFAKQRNIHNLITAKINFSNPNSTQFNENLHGKQQKSVDLFNDYKLDDKKITRDAFEIIFGQNQKNLTGSKKINIGTTETINNSSLTNSSNNNQKFLNDSNHDSNVFGNLPRNVNYNTLLNNKLNSDETLLKQVKVFSTQAHNKIQQKNKKSNSNDNLKSSLIDESLLQLQPCDQPILTLNRKINRKESQNTIVDDYEVFIGQNESSNCVENGNMQSKLVNEKFFKKAFFCDEELSNYKEERENILMTMAASKEIGESDLLSKRKFQQQHQSKNTVAFQREGNQSSLSMAESLSNDTAVSSSNNSKLAYYTLNSMNNNQNIMGQRATKILNYNDSSSSTSSLNYKSNSKLKFQPKILYPQQNNRKFISNPLIKHKFQHKVKIIIALIKIVDFATNKAKNRQKISKMNENYEKDKVTDLVTDTFSAPSDTDKLVFNKEYYKANKETEIGKDMEFALTIPPEQRSFDQIKLVRLGLSRLKSFAEYPLNMQEKICKCAFYQKIPSKRVIIRQGQKADSFYFIISGQAMVTIMEDDPRKSASESKSRILAVLKEGTCFGELAFLYNSTRTATVTSLTTVELISIGREDFFDIFMSNQGGEPEHIRFLRQCAFIKDWPLSVLLENPTSCLFHYYKRGQVILQNSAKCEYIYIVKSGSCQVIKRIHEAKPRFSFAPPTLNKETFLYDTYKSKIDTGVGSRNIENKIPWALTVEKLDKKKEIKSQHIGVKNPLYLQMQLLKPGDNFGLNLIKFEDFEHDYPTGDLSLISNGAEVLMLKKDFFLKHSNENVKQNVRKMIRPYPDTNEMQRKMQKNADWIHFKTHTLTEMYKNIKSRASSSSALTHKSTTHVY